MDPPYDIKLVFVQIITFVLRKIDKLRGRGEKREKRGREKREGETRRGEGRKGVRPLP